MLPRDQDVPVRGPEGQDKTVQFILQIWLVDRQAQSLADRLERFERPPALAVRADLGGEQMVRDRQHPVVGLTRPGHEEPYQRSRPLPTPRRE